MNQDKGELVTNYDLNEERNDCCKKMQPSEMRCTNARQKTEI